MSTTSSGAVTRTPVDLPPGPRRVFYERLLLLLALQKHARFAPESGLVPDATYSGSAGPSSSDITLPTFINKLAKACDSSRGGDTVTALAITRLPDRFVYVFGSNNRSEQQLVELKAFMQRLLEAIATAPTSQPTTKGRKAQYKAAWEVVFGQLLRFHVNRLRIYIKGLSQKIDICLGMCEAYAPEERTILINGLEPLRELVDACLRCSALGQAKDVPHTNESINEYAECTEALIQAIHRHIRDNKGHGGVTMVSLIRERLARESENWAELNHFAGRISSYHQTATVLVGARHHWAEIFDDFDIVMVPSGAGIPKPVQKSSITAHIIIGHLSSDASTIERYRNIAASLPVALDEEIQKKRGSSHWSPRPHAEVLVHNYLEYTPGGLRADRFYRGQTYIGASKQSCALCERYYASHNSGVTTRASHGKCYPNWRAPDLYQDQGLAALETRKRIMRALSEFLRDRAMHLLDEKVPHPSEFDTETQTSHPVGFSVVASQATSATGGSNSVGGAGSVVTGGSLAAASAPPSVWSGGGDDSDLSSQTELLSLGGRSVAGKLEPQIAEQEEGDVNE